MNQDILKIVKLARLAVPEEKIVSLTQELSVIFRLAKQMDDVDTRAIEPLAHPHEEKQLLRDDMVTESNQRTVLQAVAPLVVDHLYVVPPVIDV